MLHRPQTCTEDGSIQAVTSHEHTANVPWNVDSLGAGELKTAWQAEQLTLEHEQSAVAFQLPQQVWSLHVLRAPVAEMAELDCC